MDEFDKPDLTSKEERYKRKVQELIEYCLYCQPYDEGEAVWIYGDRTELDDIFYQCRVPEQHWDKIMKHLYCPYCGNSSFDLGLDVGVKTKFEKELDQHMDEVYQLYGDEVRELEEFLESYPLLAYSNKLAKRIFKELEKRQLPVCSIKGIFFRARKVETSEILPKEKMYHPPTGKPSEGRFNHAGQSHLYLANDKSTAIKEVVAEELSLLVWWQKFEILEDVKDILDLSFDWYKLTPSTSTLLLSLKVHNSIGRNDRNTELWRPDYYLTRYIMDCAKRLGYNGIKYNSTKDTTEFDVVLFFPDRINIKAIGDPSIEIFMNKKDRLDFSSDIEDI